MKEDLPKIDWIAEMHRANAEDPAYQKSLDSADAAFWAEFVRLHPEFA